MISIEDIEAFQQQQYADEEEMNQSRSFDGYQMFTDTTRIYPSDNELEYLTLGLVSEAGEFAGKVKKHLRDGTWNEQAMVNELGDVLWYVAQLASNLEYYLSEVAEINVGKLKLRKAMNTLGGSGDTR